MPHMNNNTQYRMVNCVTARRLLYIEYCINIEGYGLYTVGIAGKVQFRPTRDPGCYF